MHWTDMMNELLGSALGNMAVKRKPNGPPSAIALPSQQAQADIKAGADEHRRETNGLPGVIGGGGIFSGADPNNPYLMHLTGGNGGQASADTPISPSLAPVADENGDSPPVSPSDMPVTPTQAAGPGQPASPPSVLSGAPAKTREEQLEDQVAAAMQIKPSPWKDVGAGIVQGADNFFNHKDHPIRSWGEIKRDRKLGTLLPQLQVERDAIESKQKADQKAAEVLLKTAQAHTIGEDDARLKEKLGETERHNQAIEDYWGRKADQGDLKLANDADLLELRDKWATSKDANSKKRLALVEQEMQNRMTRAAESNQTRRDIAGQTQGGLNTRQKLAIEAQNTLTQYREAQKNGRLEEANRLKEKLAALKASAGEPPVVQP